MRARLLLNLSLLLAAAGLAVLVYMGAGEPTAETPPRLLSQSVEEIKHIRIERPGVDGLALSREQGVWHMQAPYRLAVNQVRADAVARLADAASFAGREVEGDLTRYGLEDPTLRVVLNDQILEFGDTDPLYQRRYVRVDHTVHLIPDGGYHHLLAAPAGFVHPKPLGPHGTVTGLELRGRRLVRTEEGWLAEADDTVDQVAIDALAAAWEGAQATAVRRRDPRLGVEEVVTIHDTQSTTTFEVARTEHELILMRVDAAVQYHLPLETGLRLLSLGEPAGG